MREEQQSLEMFSQDAYQISQHSLVVFPCSPLLSTVTNVFFVCVFVVVAFFFNCYYYG